ncbi:MAG TPA: helix-turn-helix domain-containing protein [Streptosporangiaceae bacterium]|nr:helix-turn-helix domain-containing protein [Streptosporangiaceae bacterium]
MARKRTYGQYCGLAHALEIVGERWALLLVRDLMLGPKRFTDLRVGLPRIPTNVLSARLKELEQAGVVRRRTLPRPAASVVYELTEYGAELEEILLRLGRWGVRTLGEPGPDDILTVDGEILALRATFRPERARGIRTSFELRIGAVVVHAIVDDGTLKPGEGAPGRSRPGAGDGRDRRAQAAAHRRGRPRRRDRERDGAAARRPGGVRALPRHLQRAHRPGRGTGLSCLSGMPTHPIRPAPRNLGRRRCI